jgi:hypothetical protein
MFDQTDIHGRPGEDQAEERRRGADQVNRV